MIRINFFAFLHEPMRLSPHWVKDNLKSKISIKFSNTYKQIKISGFSSSARLAN